MARHKYRGHIIVIKRNWSDGFHTVKYWPEDGDEKEDHVGRGGIVSYDYALNLAKDRIDEFYDDLEMLRSQQDEEVSHL